MMTAAIFRHGWNTTDNRNDALFWVNWLNVPGRFTMPNNTDRPGTSWQLEDRHKSMPPADQISVNLRSLFERIPTSYAALMQVMHTLRVRDALPAGASEQQKHAAEAMVMAGELEALYTYGSQIVRMQVQVRL